MARATTASKASNGVTRRAETSVVRELLGAAVRKVAARAREGGAGAVARGASGMKDWLEDHRVPIQLSVDVAVPVRVAWDEWMAFESISEGIHRIEDVERDGDVLSGRTSGPRGADWEADITDEREHESFAWRSVQGSDCAGLVTFHPLGDRLTRIEVDLDLLPTTPTETVVFTLGVARRRAEADLRRFKARVEFISPDAYEARESNGGSREDERADGHADHDEAPPDEGGDRGEAEEEG